MTYVTAYFPVQTMDPAELWKNVFLLKKHDNDKEDWSLTLLIVEICLCAPYSNAALERFFSLLKYVKSTIRSRLDSDVLNTLMRVKMSGPSLEEFHETFGKKCVDHWFSSKNRSRMKRNEKQRNHKRFLNSTRVKGQEKAIRRMTIWKINLND